MKFQTILGAALLMFFVFPPTFAQFVDVQKDSLSFMYRQQIIDGYSDGTYRVDAGMNRAEFTTLLLKFVKTEPDLTAKDCFADVKGTVWYVNWICTAKKKGWIEGYKDGTFRPGAILNKAEGAALVVKILGLDEPNFDPVSTGTFHDVSQNTWFFPYVHILSELYYIDWDKTFSPNSELSRGMMAEILFRHLLAQKMYKPLRSGVSYIRNSTEKLSAPEFLALTARDFFRAVKHIEAETTLDNLLQGQQEVEKAYERAKQEYSLPFPDPEGWNYKVMMEQNNFTYGVLPVSMPDREINPFYKGGFARGSYDTWAILKFDTKSKKLLAYDFFTKFVDRPSLVPNIVEVKNDQVTIAIGSAGPDPALMGWDGEKVIFQLRNFR